jgi:hypothetical protein
MLSRWSGWWCCCCCREAEAARLKSQLAASEEAKEVEAQRAEVAEQARQQQQKQAAEAAAELEVSSIPLSRSASLRGDFDWASI